MARVTEMRYPNGWVEYYTYDKMGRLLAVDDTHPSEKPAKTQKHTYKYDANGNMTYEYMRGNGTGQAKNETLYTYDALNRLVTAHDNYGNSTRTYTYDSLGNLTYETGNGSHNCDYIYNNLNQQVDRSSDNWKSHTASTYDNRGNLILEQYGKNKKLETAGEYTCDETNKMVRGVNGNAEESIYTYNGLGALMENTWIIAKNGYGYHDVSGEEDATPPTDPTPDVPDPGETTDPDTPDPGETTDPDTPDPGETTDPDTPDDGDDTDSGVNNEGNGNNNGNNGNGHSNGNNGNHNGANKGNGNNGNGNNDDNNADDPEAADATETTAADTGTLTASLVAYGNAGNGNNGNNGNGNGNQDKPTGSDVKKTSTVVKQFVVDFSSETFRPLMEHEVNGLDYRYVYSDKARLSVVVQGIENGSASLLDSRGELHAYYHCDYLGTTDYLTSAVNSKVISWTSYSEWGEITHNAVLKCGQQELDLVKEYATHDFDAVLNMYYAKARFYDADNRRFVAVDPILDPSQYDLREYVTDPMQLVQYLYVKNNAVNWIDLLGEYYIKQDSSGTYFATPAKRVSGLINTFETFGPSITRTANLLYDKYHGYTVVGGNSADNYTNLFQIWVEDVGWNQLQEWFKDEVIQKAFGEAAKEVFGVGKNLYEAITFWDRLQKNSEIPKTDYAVFHMLDLAGIVPISSSKEKVTYTVELGYIYVLAYDWFYTVPAYENVKLNAFKAIEITPGPTAYETLLSLHDMKKRGATQEEIQKQIYLYWQKYVCGAKAVNPTLNKTYYYQERLPSPLVDAPTVTKRGHIYWDMLNNYESYLQNETANFVSAGRN